MLEHESGSCREGAEAARDRIRQSIMEKRAVIFHSLFLGNLLLLKGEKMEGVKRLSSRLLVIVLTMAMLMTSMALPMNSHAAILYPKMTVKVVDDNGTTVKNPKVEVSYEDEIYDSLTDETETEIVNVNPDSEGKYKLFVNRKTTVKVSKEGYETKTEVFKPDDSKDEFEKTITLKKTGGDTPEAPADKLTPIVNRFKGEFGALVAKYGKTNNAAELVIEKINTYKDLDSEGVTVKTVSSNTESVIANDGKITYIKKDAPASTINHANVGCTFEISYNGKSQTVSRTVMVGWDVPHVNQKIKTVADGISFDTIKNGNTSENNIVSDLTLPQIDGNSVMTAWTRTQWESSNPDVLSIQDGSQFAGLNTPKKAVVKQPKKDTVVTLTARTGVNDSILNENIQKADEFNTVTKKFTLTVKGSGEEETKPEDLQALLDKYITVNDLKYFVKEDGVFDANNVVGDIQLPRYTKIKDENNKLVFKNKEIKYSTDDSAITVNGYRAAVDRFQQENKTVNLIVSFTRDNVTVTKKIPLKIAVITDAELDAEIKAMDYAKAHFFDGINNGSNVDKDSIKENLHAFYEFRFDGEKPVWVYTMAEKTGRGIVPVSYFDSSWEAETNGYSTFKSSNRDVIAHQNLIVTRPAQNTKLTVTSWLGSAKYGDLAKKYPNNAKLQKLYKQEVSVELTVLGKSSKKDVLSAKINEAKNLVAAISEGDKAGEYAKGTKHKLEKAIADAEAVNSDAGADTEKVEAAIKALEKAMKEANDAQNPIAISAIVQNESNAYTNVFGGLKVSPKEAANHGYFKSEAFANKTTVLDALVAIHHEMYGAEFDENPEKYLVVPENGFINKIFGVSTSDLGYYVNNAYPVDEKGMGTVANTTVLNNGDVLNIFRYFNQDYKAIYMSFDEKNVETKASQEFSLTLKGEKTLADWSKKKAAYVGAKVAVKDAEGNIVAEAITDKDGVAKLKVDKAGKYTATVTALAEDETVSKQFIAPYAEITVNEKEKPEVKEEDVRVAGDTRYDTAYKNADALKKQLGLEMFDSAVVACGTNYPDALSAAYLAKVKNAPLLLSDVGEVQGTVEYIRKNVTKGKTVYLIGGRRVLPEEIKTLLGSDYDVKRIEGADRFLTNLAVLKEANVNNEEIMVCSGLGYADALSAAATGRPVLLVDDALTAEQKAFLGVINPAKFYIVGGKKAVNDNVQASLSAMKNTERIAGADRFDTAVQVAKKFFDMKLSTVVIANGNGFADGIVAGVTAMANKAPLLLVDSDNLKGVADFVKEAGAKRSIVMGGARSVSDQAVKVLMGR